MPTVVPALELRRPACLQVPPGRVGSFVDDVCEVADRLGRVPEPEQRLAIDALVAHDGRKRFLSLEAGIEMPRQNGKTTSVLLPIALWTALTDPDEMTWSAHMYETSLREFRALAHPEDGLIVNNDWLRRRVQSVSEKDNDEHIVFTNRAKLNFRCRSGRRSRGLSGNTLFLDEWLYGTTEMIGAALPTLATRSVHGNARAYYASSAAKESSKHLRDLRRRAMAADPTLTWVGWWSRGGWSSPGCADGDCSHAVGVEGCALDDEDRWAEANILLDRFISRSYMRGVRRTLRGDVVEFGREHMGWQQEGDDAVDIDRWALLKDEGSVPLRRPVSLAVDVAKGLRSAAVLLAGRRADGRVHVEIAEHQRGVSWLGEFLRGKQSDLGGVAVRHLGGRAPVMSVIPDLESAGVRRLEAMSDTEFAAACGGFDQLVTAGGIHHLGDTRLGAALRVAARVDTGDGAWVMSRKGSVGDISPAVAAVVAVRDLVASGRSYDLLNSVV